MSRRSMRAVSINIGISGLITEQMQFAPGPNPFKMRQSAQGRMQITGADAPEKGCLHASILIAVCCADRVGIQLV
jgi:hypothetical protein